MMSSFGTMRETPSFQRFGGMPTSASKRPRLSDAAAGALPDDPFEGVAAGTP